MIILFERSIGCRRHRIIDSKSGPANRVEQLSRIGAAAYPVDLDLPVYTNLHPAFSRLRDDSALRCVELIWRRRIEPHKDKDSRDESKHRAEQQMPPPCYEFHGYFAQGLNSVDQ